MFPSFKRGEGWGEGGGGVTILNLSLEEGGGVQKALDSLLVINDRSSSHWEENGISSVSYAYP